MAYLGHSPTQAGSFIEVDDFGSSFNGSTVAFTLQVGSTDITPNAQNLLVVLDGVVQMSGSAYSVSGSTITFTEAPASGTDLYCLLMGQSASVGQGTIGAAELKVSGNGSSGQVLTSDGDGTFSWATDTEPYLPLAGGTMTGAINLGSQNITNGGTITGTFVGNITGNVTGNTSGTAATVTEAAQSAITSVGTLTGLTVAHNNITLQGTGETQLLINAASGNNPGIRFQENSANKWTIGNDQSNDSLFFYDFGASATRFSINSSGNATFAGGVAINGASIGSHKLVVDNGTSSLNRGNSAGDILDVRGQNTSQMKVTTTAFTVTPEATFSDNLNVDGDAKRIYVRSNDYELVSIGMAGSSGSALDQGYFRMKNAGTNTIALHSASSSYFTNGLSIGTSSINSNATLHVRQNSSGQSSSSNNTQITVENSGSAGIQILTGTTSVGGIWVGDSNGSETGGKLYYSNNSDGWTFFNQGSVQSCDIGLSMVNFYNNDSGSAGSNLKQLSLGKSDNTYWNSTNSGTFTGALISNSHNDAGTACGIAFTHRTGSSGISYIVSRNEGADASSLHFGTRGTGGVDSRMTIGKDGEVTLSAASNNKASINVVASGSGQAPNDAKVYVQKNSSNDWSFFSSAGGDNYGFKTNGSGAHAIYVTNHSASGAQTFRVEYDGDILAANTSIASISDRRLKKEITNASSQWDDIKALNFVNYKWKKSTGMDDSIKYLGLVADEVESVSPGLIKIDAQSKEDIEAGVEDPEYKTVKYSIVWMKAVKALQEAMDKIETLEAKVEALENA